MTDTKFEQHAFDDDEPPALVAVNVTAEAIDSYSPMDVDQLNIGNKVPITIVTGYLGAGSETCQFTSFGSGALFLTTALPQKQPS